MAAAAPVTYHVLGAGAMGCLFAASLARAGASSSSSSSSSSSLPQGTRVGVTLLTRRAPGAPHATIQVTETHRKGADCGGDTAQQAPVPSYEARVAVEGNDGRRDAPPISRLLVMTKAYDVRPALASLAPRLSGDSIVVLLSNGMGYYEELRAEPALRHVRRWILGTTTHGGLILDRSLPSPPPPQQQQQQQQQQRGAVSSSSSSFRRYHVSHTGMGQTFLGLPPLGSLGSPAAVAASFEGLKTVLSELQHAASYLGLEASEVTESAEASSQSMNRRLWLKLAVNACINPLTALLRKRNAVVADDPSIQPLVAALCAETAAVAHATARAEREGDVSGSSGASFSSSSSSCSSSLAAATSEALPTARELQEYVHQVARQTGRNESSMLQDVVAGRRTEIDYINGFVVREASRLNALGLTPRLEVPRHEMLLQLIHAAAPSSSSSSSADRRDR